jgi:hypothetical protein
MSHTMKLWERIIEHHLRKVTNFTESQFGFMVRRSTIDYGQLWRDTWNKRKICIWSSMTWRKPMTMTK